MNEWTECDIHGSGPFMAAKVLLATVCFGDPEMSKSHHIGGLRFTLVVLDTLERKAIITLPKKFLSRIFF